MELNFLQKRALKLIWAWFWCRLRLLNFFVWAKRKVFRTHHTVILLYHRVIPKEKKDNICSSPAIVVFQDTFEKQMRFLSEKYNIISLDDFVEARAKQIDLPLKSVVITFDDGWEDNYLYAFPILMKYKLPATFFLTAGFVGTKKLFWQEKVNFLMKKLLSSQSTFKKCFDRKNTYGLQLMLDNLIKNPKENKFLFKFIENLKSLDESIRDNLINRLADCLNNPKLPVDTNSFLKWEQIREMKNFRINFGSHGINHRILTRLSNDEVREELILSKKHIEKEIGMPVDKFAYPNGNYDDNIIAQLKAAGYKSALTVEHGSNTMKTDLFRLKRINIHEEMFTNLRANFSNELFAVYLADLL